MAGAASSSSPSEGVQPQIPKQNVFMIITRSAACTNWRNLGRVLGVSDPHIDAIAVDNRLTVNEQCYQMLVKWYQAQSAAGNKLAVLLHALRDLGYVNVAEEIEQTCIAPIDDDPNE